ncbi:RING finger and CHY zinc finger domain-containing protein 1 isoform X2 [Eurytemora carolleeae]|uniref:RING finger and CHY zinc finger domain-containing protein 1 isoform X2 n=1 Tax=Eurytemora carolleeae TaxID=1294199 RepID=UPI000C76455B|nr:RING finger and CHY zinc finger domain-containing protein 1 isoform X2 [Eurytemora carolleeae]|eukprot:XP_023347356.1 RING finger and CHY zinc finger domain-containing protein 1-like isoform X2 [Eurytemora affinis]
MSETSGCEHYTRNCSLVAPCCQNIYPCRVCHDEKESHTLDRTLVEEIVCNKCDKRSGISNECYDCKTIFGEKYFCKICRLFDHKDKGQFHCEGCGICRIGHRENFKHCFTCEMCMPIGTEHKCIAQSSRNNCPVCFESIHSSRTSTFIPPCGHLIHTPCYSDMLKTGLYSCPSCGRAMQDMKSTWEHVDREITETPMPVEYTNLFREILCKDCGKTSKSVFHVVGMKCGTVDCGSYNTSIEGPFLRREGEEFTPLSESDLQRLYTVPLPGTPFWGRVLLFTLQMLRTLEFGFGQVQNIFVYLLHGLGWFNPLQYLPQPNRGQNTGPEEEDGNEGADEEENSEGYEDIDEETDNDENEPPDHDKENAANSGNPQNDLLLD